VHSLSVHISKATVHIFDAFILFDVLAEWAVALLHVSELVLILHEEFAAALTHRDGHVGDHVLVVSLWQGWAELAIVNDKDLLVSHVLEHLFVNFDGLSGAILNLCLQLLKDLLGKEIILDVGMLVVESECLLLALHTVVLPAVFRCSWVLFDALREAILWRVHAETLHDLLQRNVWRWNELNQWQCVKASEVSNEALSTACAEVSRAVNQRVAVHASIADHLEAFFVREWFRPALEISQVNLLLPL
jgi:hypothetical protein